MGFFQFQMIHQTNHVGDRALDTVGRRVFGHL